MGLSRTVSEINGDFGRKSQIFPTSVYSTPCWRDSPWNCVSALGVKKTRMMWRYGVEKEVWRYLPAVWIQSTNVTDRQTDEPSDRHRATAKTALTHSVARLKRCDGINSQYKAAMPLSSKFSRKRNNEQQCNHFDISTSRHSDIQRKMK